MMVVMWVMLLLLLLHFVALAHAHWIEDDIATLYPESK